MLKLVSFALLVGSLAPLGAATLVVQVHDPSGAAVAGAAVRVQPSSGAAQSATTGPDGSVTLDHLPAGAAQLSVKHDGFADYDKPVELNASGQTGISVTLTIAPQQTSVEVEDKAPGMANSDPNYLAIRNSAPAESYLVENVELTRDVGTFVLSSGAISFTAAVNGRVFTAIFSGKGSFHLKPAIQFEAQHLELVSGAAEVNEDFDSAVFIFTDKTYDELKRSLKTKAECPRCAGILRDLHHRIRYRAEVPRSTGEYLLQGDGVLNIDAELLTALYNPKADGFFSAYIQGHKHGDLRFFVNPRGAVPQMLSTEESGLVSIDTNGTSDGLFYLTHLASEWRDGTALNDEDRRLATARHFNITTVVGKNDHLTSVAGVRFDGRRDGDRVFRFSLLPNLRVSRVTYGGKEIAFIQEPRKLDSGFYIILPEPVAAGQTQEVQVEYQGDKVIRGAGGGSFAVGARTDWYPNLNSFHDKSTYDLTFKVPKQYTLVSVGKQVSASREEGFAVTHWVSDVPLAVAGFNYGDFKKKQTSDQGYDFEVYATEELPDYLAVARRNSAMTPAALAQSTMVDAENSIRCFRAWFGDLPYGRIAITQQPQFNFGQSWPSLVYLPLSAFLDSTQRYMLMGSNTFKFSEFIDEVTPHEVSHQWWGHLVGWNSYHDQWLSEGFADFSAGLFLEQTEKDRSKYMGYWERSRKRILDKTNYGYSPNDAGPIWMGLRLDTAKTERAYNTVVYNKGGYVLHMLRYLMQDPKTGDADFIAMMHDFTSKYAGRNASSSDFQAVVSQHMKAQMNVDGSGNMNWFFGEWLYGTDVPAYRLTYHFTNEPDGKVLFTGKLVQSQVSASFHEGVPIYFDFGMPGGPVRTALVPVTGSGPSGEIKIRLPRKPKKVLLNYNLDVLAREAIAEEL